MKTVLKFIVILAVILLLSAFLAPILFDYLPFKFERIFNRLVMIFVLIAVFLFVRFRKETFHQYGLIWDQGSSPYFLKGFFAGFVTLFLAVVVEMVFHHARWTFGANFEKVGFAVIKNLSNAIVIGVIEEFFFRGAVFSFLRCRFSLAPSLIATNVFYSLLHFINDKKPFIGSDPTFQDSLKLIAAPFASFAGWSAIWPGAVGLFLFGLILNGLFIRTKSLYPAIGLHAGCVFFVKMDGLFVDFVERSNTLIWGSNKIYDGSVGWVFLILLGWSLEKFLVTGKHAKT